MPKLSAPERALLEGNHFNFKPLLKTNTLDLRHIFGLTLKVALVFMAEVTFHSWFWRYNHAKLSLVLAGAVAVVALFWPTVKFVLLSLSVALPSRSGREHRSPALLYWLFWPTVTIVLCSAAVGLGVALGENLWEPLSRYYHLSRLRSYTGVNPSTTPALQMQDSGRVLFTAGSVVDRAHGGCFVNGITYCVAPITLGNDTKKSESQGFFAVGTECCECENSAVTNFRCGQWSSSLAGGGLRSIEGSNLPFYQLAAQQWSATYGVSSRDPLFFRWVQDPEYEYSMLYAGAISEYYLAMVAAPPLVCCVALLASVFLGTLQAHEVVGPVGAPPEPPRVLRPVWRIALPELEKEIQVYDAAQAQKLPETYDATI